MNSPLGMFRKAATKAARWLRFALETLSLPFDRDCRVSFTNFWQSGDLEADIWFYPVLKDVAERCEPGLRCRISRVFPHIGFMSVLGEASRLDKVRASREIFFSGECVRPSGLTEWSAYGDYRLNDVDLALGFDPEDSVGSPKYLRFPLWILYLFTGLESKDEIVTRFAELNQRQFAKKKFCALIARHDRSGIRAGIVNSLASIGRIDCAGSWLTNDRSLVDEFKDDKESYLRQYKFNICPENTVAAGYVTEKLFQSFLSGCVPIYCGADGDPEPLVVNPEAVIFWEKDGDNGEVIERVRRLQEDDGAYARFVGGRRFRDTAVDFVWERLELLRSRLGELLPRGRLAEPR